MKKRDILAVTDFGHRIAEEEANGLRDYFVQTNQWRSMISGEVDVVYGAKGSGKSAIYSLLLAHRQDLNARGIHAIAAENPRGTPVFRELVTDPPATEEEFRGLWKLYFLCLVANHLRSIGNVRYPGPQVIRKLEEAELLPREASLTGMLRGVIHYVRRVFKAESLGVGIELNGTTGMPAGISGKITLREPTPNLKASGVSSIDELLKQIDSSLSQESLKVWVLLDRLDVAFADSPELEANALRALFRVYLDLIGLKAISLKIFLRSDIWNRISHGGVRGFREASHISRHTTISWNAQSLLNLIVRRLLHNEVVRQEYKADPEFILADTQRQVRLFMQIFPPQTNLDWMLFRLRDGLHQTAPRELIHLLHCARNIQLRRLELGAQEPPGPAMFEFRSLYQALVEVSNVRFEQTLCAEYPQFQPYLLRLKGESPRLPLALLGRIWKIQADEAATVAESLVEIGVLEKQGTREEPIFWVPYLYQPALQMKLRE